MPSRTNESTIDDIIWEDPPVPKKPSIKGIRDPYSTIFLKMRERPGDWVRLSHYHKQGAATTQITRWGDHKDLKNYEWAVVHVRKRYLLYCRYTGPVQPYEGGEFAIAIRKGVTS